MIIEVQDERNRRLTVEQSLAEEIRTKPNS